MIEAHRCSFRQQKKKHTAQVLLFFCQFDSPETLIRASIAIITRRLRISIVIHYMYFKYKVHYSYMYYVQVYPYSITYSSRVNGIQHMHTCIWIVQYFITKLWLINISKFWLNKIFRWFPSYGHVYKELSIH